MEKSAKNSHQEETYKSLPQIVIETFKFLSILNGGAIVATLTYVGNLVGKSDCNAHVPFIGVAIWKYIGGLIFVSVGFVFAYATQLTLYNETTNNLPHGLHKSFLYAGIACSLLSILAFACGSLTAVDELTRR